MAAGFLRYSTKCVFYIVLNAQLIAHLKQILGCAADNAVHTGFFFCRKILEIAAGFRKVEGQDFHLRSPSAVKRRFVGEDMVFHIG